jgi:hypothetical protein
MRGVLILALFVGAVEQGAAQAVLGPTTCSISKTSVVLPKTLRETSGLALAGRNQGLMWTHNDGTTPQLYALDSNGVIRGQLQVTGVGLQDWEDMDSGACEGGHCLYIADIGDNDGNRTSVAIHEIAEPVLPATQTTVRRTLRASYADGAQDAEAMFRMPNGDFYVVTKGRHRAVGLYRWHHSESGDAGTLRLVRQLAAQPGDQLDRVTAATASPNGEWVAIRTYRNLDLYRTSDLLNKAGPALTFSLVGLNEKQGESITLDNEGNIYTTSEAEKSKDSPTLAQLHCAIPRAD